MQYNEDHSYCLMYNFLSRSVVYQILFLFFIVTGGLILRLVNISPFNYYPDAYQSLLVANNIATYHSVIGTLGPHGMVYPDFFEWTRPMYPLLILFAHLFQPDYIFAAHAVSLITGVLAIGLAYFFIRTTFQSVIAGLTAAFLVATSFNHVVWGGYILTETTGIFFLLLFLYSLFDRLKQPVPFAALQDVVSGLLLCCAVFTRSHFKI